jgi:hypothetical protein
MTLSKSLPAIAALVLLAACEARFGNDAAEVSENATAAGRAEEGRLTVEAPGFNMQIDIPEGIRASAEMDGDDGLIYPGSTFGGIHVQGRPERAGGESDGEVELRFATGDAVDRVVAWYRDPARGEDVRIASAERRGNAFVLSGTSRDGKRFDLSITPRAAGGTEARMVLQDRNR